MTAYFYQRLLLAIRVLLIVTFAIILYCLISRDLVLSGQISYEHDLSKPSPFFSQVVPLDRTQATDDGLQIMDEPVYLSLSYPRPFQQVDVRVDFLNPDLLFLEMGPLAGIPEYYERQALYHPQLEQLAVSETWELAGERLMQRGAANYRYASAEQLFDQPPAQQEVGYYGLDWSTPYLPNFDAQKENASVPYPLRGAQKAFVALNQDELRVSLSVSSFHDLAGSDDMQVRLLDWQGNLLAERLIPQPERSTGVTSAKTSEELVFTALTYPAIYQLEFVTTNDTVLHELAVNTPYLVFDGGIRLAGGPEYQKAYGELDISGSALLTSARSWHAQTDSFDSLQTLRMAEAGITLEQPLEAVRYAPGRSFRFLIEKGYEIYLQKGDVMLQGKGVFGVSPSSFFNPYPWYVDGALDPDLLGLDYVVVNYTPVQRENGLFRQTVSVDLAKAFAPEKQLRMQIAAPRMIDGQTFTVKHLQADYVSEPVTLGNAKEKFLRFFKRDILR